MKASERWLRGRADAHPMSHEPIIRLGVLPNLRHRYAPEIARIDAAEARFEGCSQDARDLANWSLRFQWTWETIPLRWEALADVAEGIDKRARRGSAAWDVAGRSDAARAFDAQGSDRRARGEPSDGEPTAEEMFQWALSHQLSASWQGSMIRLQWFEDGKRHSHWCPDATETQRALLAAMLRERGAKGET